MNNELEKKEFAYDIKVIEGKVSFNNFEEVKKDIVERLKPYQDLVLTSENKQELKNINAELNNFDKKLNAERIALKKDYMKPFDNLELQVKEISSYIKEVVDKNKTQIDTQETAEKVKKQKDIEKYFNELKASYQEKLLVSNVKIDFVSFEDMQLNITLTNSPVSYMKLVDSKLEKIYNDLLAIESNEYSARLYVKYQKSNFDLARAMKEVNDDIRIENQVINNSAVEQPKVEQVKDDIKPNIPQEIHIVRFVIEDSLDNIKKLKQFIVDNNINYSVENKKGE